MKRNSSVILVTQPEGMSRAEVADLILGRVRLHITNPEAIAIIRAIRDDLNATWGFDQFNPLVLPTR
jgi:hypothetical protein